MDLRRLEIFAKVAEIGSFSRAADALSLTQPTVSEHVRGLEDELGVQLLDRLGRGAAPTRAGILFLGYAQRLLALAREARQAIDQFQGRTSGELTVGYPEISISLLIGDSRQVTEWVDGGRVEVGVVGARPATRTVEWRELASDELVVVVPAGHRWFDFSTVTVAALRAEPLVLRERGSGSRQALERALEEAGLALGAFRVVGEMGSTQAIKQAVRAGVGVSLISRRAVADECRARLLHCVAVKDLRVSRSFYLVTHRDRSRSPLAAAFLEFLESQVLAGAS
jgi:DNA-binding transcriptional LysR family regulator